jgi:hypothetical protein
MTKINLLFIFMISFCNLILAQSETASMQDPKQKFSSAQAYEFDEAKNALNIICVESNSSGEVKSEEEIAGKDDKGKDDKKSSLLKKAGFENPFKAVKNAAAESKNNPFLNSKYMNPNELSNETFTVTTYQFPLKKNSFEGAKISEEFFTNIKLDPTKKYKYVQRKTATEVLSLEQAAAKYPTLNLGKEGKYVSLQSKGDGLLQNKNVRLNTLVFGEIIRGIGVTFTGEAPFMKEQNEKYKDYMTNTYNSLTNETGDLFVNIAHLNDGDNYYVNKNFSLFYMDKTGAIKKTVEIKKDYIKTINTFTYVYDEKGIKKGILMVLGNQMALKKSLKDPIENNFHVIYTDFEGNVKINKDIPYGNSDNWRCLNPVLVTEKEGSLHILNMNRNKILSVKMEVVDIAMDGTVKRT